MIQARNLGAGYGPRAVLAKLSFDLPWRRTTVVLGSGGSGKSTLLRALVNGGLGDGADFWVRGELSLPVSAQAVVPQSRPAESRSLGELLGPDARQTLESVWACAPAAAVRLDRLRERPVALLPEGLWRLALLTAAIASKAPLVLLDEPEVGLTGDSVRWLARRLLMLRAERTVVLVTQHLPLARMVADHVLLIDDGMLVDQASPRDFFDEPTSPGIRQRTG
ncbi:ABC transporter ATP-binding protein [Corallococcus macrosporus]|uniref:ABC transporter ATP-binding protein n=1 Tax=Corallococcus macrosporus DSM 14697 TaxID=1189310 RepID=A0A250JMG0_9BACT|nr:ABC transporter ATP-binding protein [Corallococcus macrosporus]ATB45059.1 ABC transporter ATP-binding protein [Corallococcus macrosporus DSM 14697]